MSEPEPIRLFQAVVPAEGSGLQVEVPAVKQALVPARAVETEWLHAYHPSAWECAVAYNDRHGPGGNEKLRDDDEQAAPPTPA